jgi:hypothetical protein
MGEMSERYVRDYFHPSHAQIPLYKGDSSNYVRDERFFVNKARLLLENADLMAPIVPILGTNHSQLGNKTFPYWE